MQIIQSTAYGINIKGEGGIRTAGVHLSGILRKIALLTGELKAEYGQPGNDLGLLIRTTEPEQAGACGPVMRAAIGFMWESWLSKRVPGLIHQPGEMFLDGIVCSPDGISVDLTTGAIILHEFKATWASTSKPVSEKLMWLWQIQGYLAALSKKFEEKCTRAVLHPLYMNGDYRRDSPNSGPVYMPVELEFEWEEIERNWEMVLQHKHLAIPEGSE